MSFRTVTLACAVLLASRDARAFVGREHRAIGGQAYKAACARLAPLASREPERARFRIACDNLEVQALLYAQGCAVSGDWSGAPDDFMTSVGAQLVNTKPNYWRLALTNSAHFHPIATREWRAFHGEAIALALAAAQARGAKQLEGFEQAFYNSAFGDHFLQDSFAAGHMGFNRPGSSAAAAKAFHDEWNVRGRWVSNRRGEVWKTYGDAQLDRPESRVARAHVLAATTESVYGVLAAFVLGVYDPTADIAVWYEVPFTIEDPEILPDLERMFSRWSPLARPELLPLLSVKRPAVKDGIVGAWSAFTTTFDDPDDASGALVIGGDLLLPGVGARIEAGLGIGYAGSFTEPRFAVDAGVVRGVGLSVDGLISHEIDLGALLLAGGDVDVTLRLSYRSNIEAGDWLLRFDLGPAFAIADAEFGFYAALGLAKVLGAAGGGGFF